MGKQKGGLGLTALSDLCCLCCCAREGRFLVLNVTQNAIRIEACSYIRL